MRRYALLLTAPLAAFALAGCGSSGSASSSAPPMTTATVKAAVHAPHTTTTTVKAAVPLPKIGALKATVGPGFTISLTQANSHKPVTTLKAGRYLIVVRDLSNIHDFHLTGPGIDKSTSVSGKGTSVWKLNLKPGNYSYVCDPHASIMKGSFTVS